MSTQKLKMARLHWTLLVGKLKHTSYICSERPRACAFMYVGGEWAGAQGMVLSYTAHQPNA